ncbi:restriction endonuclease subunit S domain-containing protein [Rothia uropygioeca]|uniref:restriction endonuclease subunit S n=1 Tax=Kocuria sp. 257 TaxID=2021970 RepID=UPI0010131F88|nr:restriction endonuclease subunit S [Kocuria sp. 257]
MSWLPWTSELPSNWQVVPARAMLEPVRRDPQSNDMTVTAFRDGQVTLRSNRRVDGFTESVKEIGYQGVRRGEVVIHSMDAFAGAIGVSDSDGKMSPVVHIYTAPSDNPEFIVHSLRAASRAGFIRALAKGIRERSTSFDRPVLKSMALPRPPRDTQDAIVAYLDRETQKIDELITEQRSLIETLRERRQAVIDSVFGVKDVNSRMYAACLDVVDCPHSTPEIDLDGEFEAVRTASIRNGSFRQGHGLRVSEATWRERNAGGAPRLGDVLFTREAPAGEACMVPDINVCLGQRMVLLRVNQARADGRFIMWQIYSRIVQDYFRAHSNGSTVNNVRLPLLRGLPIWLPSVGEQRQVTAYLDDQTSRIDELISESEDLITLSQERRAALITAAVTGQIDVRTAS